MRSGPARRLKAENGPAYIEVTAREKNGHLFLQFVNPCPEGIQFENGLPVTHAEGHGIGVRSICAIVEKYKGLSDFSVRTADSSSAFLCEPGRLSAVSGESCQTVHRRGRKEYTGTRQNVLSEYRTRRKSFMKRITSLALSAALLASLRHRCWPRRPSLWMRPLRQLCWKRKTLCGSSAGRHADMSNTVWSFAGGYIDGGEMTQARDGRVSGGIRRYAAVHL